MQKFLNQIRCRLSSLLIFISAVTCLPATGQQKFNKDGQFQGKADSLRYSSATTVGHDASALSDKEIKKIKDMLSEKIQRALTNANNPEIREQYIAIWDQAFADELVEELKALQKYLLTNTIDARTYKWVPDPNKLKTEIFEKDAFLTLDGTNSDPSLLRKFLIKNDLFNTWLLDYYTNSAAGDPIPARILDDKYLEEWRAIERKFSATLSEIAEIKQMDSVLEFNKTRLKEIENGQGSYDISSSDLVKQIKGSKFMKKWLWYTDGIVTINPLMATTSDLIYPVNERNRFLTPALAHQLDSLNKSNRLKEISQTGSVYNDVLLVQNEPADKNKFLIQYDASQKFKKFYEFSVEFVNKETYQVAVYNIGREQAIEISAKPENLNDESRAISALNALAEEIGSVVGITKPNLAVFARLEDAINPATFPTITIKKINGVTIEKGGEEKFVITDYNPFYPVGNSIIVGNISVPLTQTDQALDKRNLLGAAMIQSDDPKINYDFERYVSKFITLNRYQFLNYTNVASMDKSIDKLNKDFEAFRLKTQTAQTDAKKVSEMVYASKRNLEPYLAIYQRSLPPKKLDPVVETENTPVYSTKIHSPTFPDPPKKLTYVITSKSPADGPEPRQVVKETTKIVKTHYLDFSIGIAYTFSDYDVVSQSGKDMPVVEVGDRVNFMAGAHWYPCGINRLRDEWFKHSKERFSLYVGTSISNVFDNFYGGLSYDPTPGIRAILGVHLYKDYRFKIINDQVAEKATGLAVAGGFISISLQPVTIGKAIGLFK